MEEKKDINAQVSELTSYAYETLVNKIKSLEEKNNEYQKQFEEMKKEYRNKFEQLLEMNKKNENKISNLEKMIKDLNNLNDKKVKETSLFNSKINIDESLVKSWLNNRNFKATLLFRMSENGDSFDIFHNKCDNKGITIVFIETIDGYKFGGYTELCWDIYSNNKYDNSTFIFSFNYKEKYTKRNNEYSIGCVNYDGPRFGYGPQICFNSNLKKGQSFKSDKNAFVLNNIFVDGKEYWTTKELEVFQIIYY